MNDLREKYGRIFEREESYKPSNHAVNPKYGNREANLKASINIPTPNIFIPFPTFQSFILAGISAVILWKTYTIYKDANTSPHQPIPTSIALTTPIPTADPTLNLPGFTPVTAIAKGEETIPQTHSAVITTLPDPQTLLQLKSNPQYANLPLEEINRLILQPQHTQFGVVDPALVAALYHNTSFTTEEIVGLLTDPKYQHYLQDGITDPKALITNFLGEADKEGIEETMADYKEIRSQIYPNLEQELNSIPTLQNAKP